MFQEAAAHIQCPQERPFYPEAVEAWSGAKVTVSKAFVALTYGEMVKALGRAPKAKDPKVPTVVLNGETLYCFKDQREPHRLLQVSSEAGECKMQRLMKDEQHYHRDQGQEMLRVSEERRMTSSKVGALMQPRSITEQPTLQEYLFKLGIMPEPSAGERTGSSTGVTNMSSASVLDRADDGDAALDEPEVPASHLESAPASSIGAATAATPAATPAIAAAVPVEEIQESPSAASKRVSSFLSEAVPPKPAKVSKNAAGGKSGHGFGRSGSSASIAGDDGTSRMSDESGLKGDGSSQAQSWVEKIDIAAILGGRRLGVQMFHAESFAKKLESAAPAQAHVLLNQVQLGRWAASLSCKAIEDPKTTDHELAQAILGLTGKFTLPGENQLALFHRQVQPLQREAHASSSEESIRKLLAFVTPVLAADEVQCVDWSSMRLAGVDYKRPVKEHAFLTLLLDFLCGLISMGECKRNSLSKTCDVMRKFVEEQLERTVPDSYVDRLVELAMVLQALQWVLSDDPLLQLQKWEEIEVLRGGMRTTQTSPMARIGNALAAEKYYSEVVSDMCQTVTALQTHESKLNFVDEMGKGLVYAAQPKLVQQLSEMVTQIVFLKEVVNMSVLKDMLERACIRVEKVMGDALAKWEQHRPCEITIDSAQKLLAEARPCHKKM